MKVVDVVVKPDGSVHIVYSGFVGEACFEEAKRLYETLRVLGVEVKVERVEKTSEAYTTTKTSTKVVNNV